MDKTKIIKLFLIVSLLTIAFLALPVKADVDITVTTTGNADVELNTGGGALVSFDYNGRDLLQELQDKADAIHAIKVGMIFLANQQNMDRLEDELAALEEDIRKLIIELNEAFGDVYFNLHMQAHVIGINPGNSTVAITLISGNKTVAEFIQDNRDELVIIELQLDAIDARITMLDDELHMMLDEQAQDIDKNNETIQEMQKYLTERREYMDGRLIEIDGKFLMNYIFIAGMIVVVLVLVYVNGTEYMRLNQKLKALALLHPARIRLKDPSEDEEE